MRPRSLIATLLLVATISAGCSAVNDGCTKAYVKCNPLARDPQEPVITGGFTSVQPQDLPAELATWQELTPGRHGAVSAVVDGSLYVLVSFGELNYANYGIKITEVKVEAQRVKVKAYFSMTSNTSIQRTIYPKDYAKLPYKGKEPLPVQVDMSYDSAAFAYIPGAFDQVDPQLLPPSLAAWKSSNAPTEAALFGDYLYVGDKVPPVQVEFQPPK